MNRTIRTGVASMAVRAMVAAVATGAMVAAMVAASGAAPASTPGLAGATGARAASPSNSVLYASLGPGMPVSATDTGTYGGIAAFDPTDLAAGMSMTYSSTPYAPAGTADTNMGIASTADVDGMLVGLGLDGTTLRIVNPATGGERTLVVSGGPSSPMGRVFDVAAAPGGGRLYLVGTTATGLRMATVDTFTWTESSPETIDPGGSAPATGGQATVDPSTGDLWVPTADGVVVVDPTSNRTATVLPGGSPGQVAFDGADAWVPVGPTIVEVATGDLQTTRTVLLPGTAGPSVAAPGGVDVYVDVVEAGSVDVVAVGAANGAVTDLGPAFSWTALEQVGTTAIAMSADGSTVFTAGNVHAITGDYWDASPIREVDTATGTYSADVGGVGRLPGGNPPTLNALLPVPAAGPATGYWEVASDGGIFSFGDAGYHGSMGGRHLNAPVVGMAATPDGGGYWEVASDGGIFSFGDAGYHGSMGGTHLNAPVVGMAATPDGKGYWLVASDGGIFSFGDAGYHGSMGGTHLNSPVVGMAATVDGGGYWLVASDGGVFSFGDAGYHGSMGGRHLNAPVVGMAADASTGGYWLVASDGGVFSFFAPFLGSAAGSPLAGPVRDVAPSPAGTGYWIVGGGGALDGFGTAADDGSTGGSSLVAPVVGMTASGGRP